MLLQSMHSNILPKCGAYTKVCPGCGTPASSKKGKLTNAATDAQDDFCCQRAFASLNVY